MESSTNVVPKMDGSFHGKSIYKWMIWGYTYFRNPPYLNAYVYCMHTNTYVCAKVKHGTCALVIPPALD